MAAKRVRLIHWNADQARARAGTLSALGYEVASAPLDPAGLREIREHPPDALVIDLTRLPAQGRDLGLTLRKYKATRSVPLVFVEGDPRKVSRIKELLPDAVYTSWSRIKSALAKAISSPSPDPVVPDSVFAAYAHTPLQKKLGIKAGYTVALIDAPGAFEALLGDLPENATIRRQARGRCDLTIWFVKSSKELKKRIEKIGARAGKGGLWIAWPKKGAEVPSDLTQTLVRKTGLAAGLVDYKVCAIDATWTGLRFKRR